MIVILKQNADAAAVAALCRSFEQSGLAIHE